MKIKPVLGYEEWVNIGQKNGWIGACVCSTHDGIPSSEEEDSSFENGDDVCMWIFRRYDNQGHGKKVEENHSPSVWRKNT